MYVLLAKMHVSLNWKEFGNVLNHGMPLRYMSTTRADEDFPCISKPSGEEMNLSAWRSNNDNFITKSYHIQHYNVSYSLNKQVTI